MVWKDGDAKQYLASDVHHVPKEIGRERKMETISDHLNSPAQWSSPQILRRSHRYSKPGTDLLVFSQIARRDLQLHCRYFLNCRYIVWWNWRGHPGRLGSEAGLEYLR